MTWKRYVHPDLMAALQSRRTSLCNLLKIIPSTGPAFGLCSLNRAVKYDDGDGEIRYCARYGFDPSAFQKAADTSIGNAEFTSLLGTADSLNEWGVTAEMIDRGYLEGARYVVYLIDYEDPGTGKHAEIDSGRLGQLRQPHTGMCVFEGRGRMQQLAQKSMCERDSISCRNTFGVNRNGDGCFADVESLWVDFTVTAVSTSEPDIQFQASGLGQPTDFFFPGKVVWEDGENAGQSNEVEGFSGGTVTLAHPTRRAIAVGDQGRIRPDCTHLRDGANGCKAWGQMKNYDGEHSLPEGESRTNQTPKGTT